jgi:hypothetical protein
MRRSSNSQCGIAQTLPPSINSFAVCMVHLIIILSTINLAAKASWIGPLEHYGPAVDLPRIENSDLLIRLYYAPPYVQTQCNAIVISIDKNQALFFHQSQISIAKLLEKLPAQMRIEASKVALYRRPGAFSQKKALRKSAAGFSCPQPAGSYPLLPGSSRAYRG